MTIQGIRAPQSSDRRHGGPAPTVRYPGTALWPGITSGHDSRCSCTWAMWSGAYQVKVRDAVCLNHGGSSAGGAP